MKSNEEELVSSLIDFLSQTTGDVTVMCSTAMREEMRKALRLSATESVEDTWPVQRRVVWQVDPGLEKWTVCFQGKPKVSA